MKPPPSPTLPDEPLAHTLLCHALIERRISHEDAIAVALDLSAQADLSQIAACLISHGIHLEERWMLRAHQHDVTSKRLQRLQNFVNILRAGEPQPDQRGALLYIVGRLDAADLTALEVWLNARGQP